ncbi:hypothetical protein N7509_010446 [Penicillium cosmopolitanum]|uniref:Uncharacterized protein n=1 Tax=Penicillium cosmopolitanum TaxID=1131564 RepID=A0A9X0B4L7_9EURO|nr:uncharacterized protein N7509_010446 [Penicillium cosmopolitanum]KAJ5387905.1 hypothetical protein N7509_010446 [Penicillium cosmopolitanum]
MRWWDGIAQLINQVVSARGGKRPVMSVHLLPLPFGKPSARTVKRGERKKWLDANPDEQSDEGVDRTIQTLLPTVDTILVYSAELKLLLVPSDVAGKDAQTATAFLVKKYWFDI